MRLSILLYGAFVLIAGGVLLVAPRRTRGIGVAIQRGGHDARPCSAGARVRRDACRGGKRDYCLITSDGRGGSNLSTETRVFADNAAGVRQFAVYWRMIHPGSDSIRRMWLRAIKRRAEA